MCNINLSPTAHHYAPAPAPAHHYAPASSALSVLPSAQPRFASNHLIPKRASPQTSAITTCAAIAITLTDSNRCSTSSSIWKSCSICRLRTQLTMPARTADVPFVGEELCHSLSVLTADSAIHHQHTWLTCYSLEKSCATRGRHAQLMCHSHSRSVHTAAVPSSQMRSRPGCAHS